MITSLSRLCVPAVAFTFLLAPVAEARPGGDEAERMAHKEQRIERKVQEKIAPKLGLDERAAERLAALMKEKHQERRALMKEVKQERAALRSLVNDGAPEGELAAQLARLQEASAKVPPRGALLDDTRSFLTVEQQARLALMTTKYGKHGKHGRYGKHGKHGRFGKGDKGERMQQRRSLER